MISSHSWRTTKFETWVLRGEKCTILQKETFKNFICTVPWICKLLFSRSLVQSNTNFKIKIPACQMFWVMRGGDMFKWCVFIFWKYTALLDGRLLNLSMFWGSRENHIDESPILESRHSKDYICKLFDLILVLIFK